MNTPLATPKRLARRWGFRVADGVIMGDDNTGDHGILRIRWWYLVSLTLAVAGGVIGRVVPTEKWGRGGLKLERSLTAMRLGCSERQGYAVLA